AVACLVPRGLLEAHGERGPHAAQADVAESIALFALDVEWLPLVVGEARTLRDHDDTEILAPLVTPLDGVLDLVQAHGELGDQNHVRAPGDARLERDPSGVPP